MPNVLVRVTAKSSLVKVFRVTPAPEETAGDIEDRAAGYAQDELDAGELAGWDLCGADGDIIRAEIEEGSSV